MRVVVISTPIFRLGGMGLSGYGGLEQIAWECARGLAKKGHDVSLVAPDGSECPGVKILQCGPAGMVSEEQAYGGFGDIRDGSNDVLRPAHPGYWQQLVDADVVIDHGWQKWSFCLKAEGRLKAPILAVLHAPVNTMYQMWPPNYPGLPPVERACPVCISEDQAAHFLALHGRSARVCHNGIDLDFYKSTGVPRTNRFLFLARFSSIKGALIAEDVCRYAGVGLDLVGDTTITNEPDYFEACKRGCDGERVRMVGPASRSECVHWLSRSHAFLHPNKLFREPFGLAPVEAMAVGCPVVCWDYGAMRETVLHGVTGYLCNSVEEMVGSVVALRDASPDRMAEFRGRCRERAREFTVQRMADRYEELCREALRSGGW